MPNPDAVHYIYTYGQPRVGNNAFRTFYNNGSSFNEAVGSSFLTVSLTLTLTLTLIGFLIRDREHPENDSLRPKST